jgi:hypothetical protein
MINHKKTLVATLIVLMLTAMIVPLIKAETLTSDKLTYYIGQDNQAILTGTDFAVGSSVTIQVTIAEDATYLFNSDPIVVGADGAFTYTYPLPGIEGTYTAAALDEAGNVLATTTFDDPPPATISLSSSSGIVGATISVTGTGWGNTRSVEIDFDGSSVATTTSTAGGAISTTFAVPSVTAGIHLVTAHTTSGSPSYTTDQPSPFYVVKTEAFGLDAVATASQTGGGDVTVTLTTLAAKDVIIVMFGSDNPDYTVSSVTDNQGLSYTHRSASLPAINTGQELVDEYWAVSSSAIASDTITVHVSGSGGNPNFVVVAFAISGANTNSPFDVNAGLPYIATGSNSVPSVAGISTSYANDIIIGLEGHTGGTLETPGSGYLLITSANDEVGSAEFKTLSATLSSATVSFGTSVTAKWAIIADAIKAPPQITLNPTSGQVGDSVSISGSGFAASSAITATFGGSAVTLSGTTTTDADGAFTGATFTVPASTAGGHTVEVTDASSNFADATFTVTPKITLNPTSGPVGTTVTVTGTGFAGTSTVTIKFDGVTQTTVPPTVTTSAVGSFTCTFNVPSASLGPHTVSATDAAANAASATFTVTGGGFCAITSRGWEDLDTFKLIFTPDVPINPSYYRVTATNPGQFSYNVLKPDSVPDDVFTITLPYPFVTQGANPVLIYDGTPIDNVPTGNVINGQFTISGSPVTLSSYDATGTFGDTVTITITNVDYTGSAYITIHLDYGLKKVAGGYGIGAYNSATEKVGTFGDIDEASYEFTVAGAVGCDDSVSNVNVFKHDPGIGGLVLDALGSPASDVTVQIYSGTKVTAKSTPLVTLTLDEDGWYMWNYKYTGKPASFTVVVNGQTQTGTLKANGFLIVSFEG